MKLLYVIILGLLFGCGVATGGPSMGYDDDSELGIGQPRGMNEELEVKQGWSASGRLVTLNRTRQVALQADFPSAESYVIQFNKIDNPNSDYPIRAIANITWSVEGNAITRTVTIANGVAIQGVAQAVRVVLVDDTIQLDVTDVPYEYEVNMQVAPGSRGGDSIPPTYVPAGATDVTIDTASPTLNLEVDIPKTAGVKSYAVYATARTIGGVPVAIPEGFLRAFQEQNGYNVAANDCLAVNNGKFFPVVSGADKLNLLVEPTLAASARYVTLTVIFGIDG